jgi:hypothetical protein
MTCSTAARNGTDSLVPARYAKASLAAQHLTVSLGGLRERKYALRLDGHAFAAQQISRQCYESSGELAVGGRIK